jgi:sodium-dependent dicarboxylate transporter 2/3/5
MSVKNIQKAELTKLLFFALALLCMVLIKELPFGESVRIIGDAELTKSGQAALGILVFTIILWMTEAMPFHITGLLSMVLLALFRVESFRQIVNVGFGNDTIVFFIGVLILSAFITASGLGRRIGVWILSKTGNSTSMIILGFIMAGTLLSMWVTEMAAAEMLTPLAVSILLEEHIEPLTSNFGRALMIGCAWGCAFGGVGTPSGSGTNPLAIGFIREMAGVEISYGQWMIYGIPVSLCMMPAGWLVLRLFF